MLTPSDASSSTASKPISCSEAGVEQSLNSTNTYPSLPPPSKAELLEAVGSVRRYVEGGYRSREREAALPQPSSHDAPVSVHYVPNRKAIVLDNGREAKLICDYNGVLPLNGLFQQMLRACASPFLLEIPWADLITLLDSVDWFDYATFLESQPEAFAHVINVFQSMKFTTDWYVTFAIYIRTHPPVALQHGVGP